LSGDAQFDGHIIIENQNMSIATDQLLQNYELSSKALAFQRLRDEIIDHWENSARASIRGAVDVPSPVLTDTLPAFLDNIAEALSPEHPRKDATSDNTAASAHGGERARMTPFMAGDIAFEYQLLRQSIEHVTIDRVGMESADWAIVDRSLNFATIEAIRSFVEVRDELRARAAATLSHDMRTPLSIIANAAQLIELSTDILVAKKMSSKISSNTRRLEAMLIELVDALTHQRSTNSAMTLVEFDMLTLAQEICEQYGLGHGSGAVIRVLGQSVVGHWSPDTMRRALENLVNNAIKYGDGQEIQIKVRENRRRLLLSVTNRGVPIPRDRQERIFDYLERDEGATSALGWGIGLPFVKSVAEEHGGTVAVDSSAQMGTTFLIDVPVDCRPYVKVVDGQTAAPL
jgi:signal transduction histidine kinase